MISAVPPVRSRAPLAAALLLLATAAVPASAQTLPEPGTMSVTPFLHTSLGIGDPAQDDSAGLGVAFSYDWTPKLSFEGEVSHLFDVAGESAIVDWSVTNFHGNALYHFDTEYVTPYVTLGLGFQRSGQSIKETDPLALVADFSGTEFAVNFGGGVKYALADRWQLRGDLRRFQANDLAPDSWRLYAGLTYKLR